MAGLFTTEEQRQSFATDGAVCLRGAFADWVETIAEGIEANMASPGPYAAENVADGEPGRFWDDYCNWQRIAPYEQVIRQSNAAAIAGELMASSSVQFFHDHALVKEANTPTPTPWHSDAPYYFVDGTQNVSLWIPVDAVATSSIRLIAESHRWPKDVLPTRWLAGEPFYEDSADFLAVPDPDIDRGASRVIEWEMQPGDAVAFHYRTVHGARGNETAHRRRAFSMRFVGDDARYIARSGRTSPPFPGHDMVDGQRLRADWFPYLIGSAEDEEPGGSAPVRPPPSVDN